MVDHWIRSSRYGKLANSPWSATETFVAGWTNAALWLVDLPEREHICCVPSCEFDEKRATKPKFVAQSRPALYFSQHLSSTCNKLWMFLLCDKLITQGEKRETSTKTCNETMLRAKLRVFVSRISPPLWQCESKRMYEYNLNVKKRKWFPEVNLATVFSRFRTTKANSQLYSLSAWSVELRQGWCTYQLLILCIG